MKTFINVLILIHIFCGVSLAQLPPVEEEFHSRAELSDSDKVQVIIRKLNQALENRNTEKILNLISPDLQGNRQIVDSVEARFDSVFARLDNMAAAYSAKMGASKQLSIAPEFHVGEAEIIYLDADTAAVRHKVYLGEDSRECGTDTAVHLDNWFGMYGVRDIAAVAERMDELLDDSMSAAAFGEYRLPEHQDKTASSGYSTINLFYPIKFLEKVASDYQCQVFNHQFAQAKLDRKLFQRPLDILENIWDNGLGQKYWGLAVTDFDWNRFIMFASNYTDDDPWLGDKESYTYGNPPEIGTFHAAGGVSMRTEQDLYVCDVFNERIARYSVNTTPPSIEPMPFIYNGEDCYQYPCDLDAAMIPHHNMPSQQYCNYFDHWVAICDQGRKSIIITQNQGGFVKEIFGGLIDPVSVAFGREWQMGWQQHVLYVADKGAGRIVKFYDRPGDSIGTFGGRATTGSGIFEDNCDLSSVEVDNFGNVYALDRRNCRIYKFTEDLEFLGAWGERGKNVFHLYSPSRISVTRGWHTGNYFTCQDMYIPSRYGNLLVTEMYTDSTGMKRYQIDNEFTGFNAYYKVRSCGGNVLDDYIAVDWEQADYGNVRLKVWLNGSSVGDTTILCLPGRNFRLYRLPTTPPLPPAGDYSVDLTLFKAYSSGGNIGYSDRRYQSGEYDRDTCNFPPVLTNLSLRGVDDDCVVDGHSYCAMASAVDYETPKNRLRFDWKAINGGFWLMDDTSGCCHDSVFGFGMDTVWFRVTLPLDTIPFPRRMAMKPAIDLKGLFSVRIYDLQGASTPEVTYKAEVVEYVGECNDVPPGPECPILYWEHDGQWKQINNLLAESDRTDRATEYVSEIYPAYGLSPESDGRFHLRITEESDEITTMRSLRAVRVSYDPKLILAFTNRQRLVTLSDKYFAPSRAYTIAGDTVIDLVSYPDKKLFVDTGPGSLIVEYDFGGSAGGYLKPTIAGPGGPVLPPPDKEINKPMITTNGEGWKRLYEIYALDKLGAWLPVTKIFPRMIPVPQYLEMDNYIIDNKLTVKIDYHSSIEIDHIPYYLYDDPVNVAVYPLRLASAMYIGTTETAPLLQSEETGEVLLKKGEYIDVILQGPAPVEGMKQLLLLSTGGKYEIPAASGRGTEIVFNQNFPNPFNPNTVFSFYLPEARHVRLEIFNILGQRVVVLADAVFPAGDNQLNWDSRNASGKQVASGIYLARFTSDDFTSSKKIEVVR